MMSRLLQDLVSTVAQSGVFKKVPMCSTVLQSSIQSVCRSFYVPCLQQGSDVFVDQEEFYQILRDQARNDSTTRLLGLRMRSLNPWSVSVNTPMLKGFF